MDGHITLLSPFGVSHVRQLACNLLIVGEAGKRYGLALPQINVFAHKGVLVNH